MLEQNKSTLLLVLGCEYLFKPLNQTGTVFNKYIKINGMVRANSSSSSKKLAFRFIQENIDYRKRCLYLQEIISMGKSHIVWRRALAAFFDTPLNNCSLKVFSKN